MRSLFLALLFCLVCRYADASTIVINEVMPKNSQTIQDEDGDYSDWFELLNVSSIPVLLEGYGLSDQSSDLFRWRMPAVEIQPGEHLLVFASNKDRYIPSAQLHVNFKLSADGETLCLSSPDSAVVDSVRLAAVPADVSFGRLPDGGEGWALLANPTPGGMNNSEIFPSASPAPSFSPKGGFYPGSLSVSIQCDSGTAEIRYTLDGSEPNETSPRYTRSLQISETTALRARAFLPGFSPGPIATATYFIHETQNLPVVSLVTDPPNLWDWETGIYVEGPNAQPYDEHPGANYWMGWEKPVHVEFYEWDGSPAFRLDAGMKIFGGWSRARTQKPVAIFARSEYGPGKIDYQLFPDKPIQTFESFLLRNSGNDWDGAFLRDAFMQTLVKGRMDIEIMAYRPAVVYLNGEYWGIQDIREKQNEHYLASNTGVDPDRVDLLENEGLNDDDVIEGSQEAYADLIHYIEQHGVQSAEDYAYVASLVDIENFAEYMIAQIYYDNKDWPGNNIKFWRPQAAGGKWRWLLYDTDFGFNLYGDTNYEYNTLAFALEPYGSGWPNPPWSTFLLRNLVQNQSFRDLFINRFADHLNTTFRYERVLGILTQMKEVIEPEIPRHHEKWPNSVRSWENQILSMETFAEYRPELMFTFLQSQFNLSGTYTLTLTVSNSARGKIRVNSQTLDAFPWTGNYFKGKGLPIRLTAIPNPGFRFRGWNDGISEYTRTVTSSKDLSLSAKFEPAESATARILINEINYNSDGGYDTRDWIELFNGSETSVDLAGWTFRDEDPDHGFVFPDGSVIDPCAYLVLCRDTTALTLYQKRIDRVAGDLDFDLGNGGDALKLYDASGQLMDSVLYDDAAPWPPDADGQGVTLALRDPALDNDLPENWMASREIGGTPGKTNIHDSAVQDRVTVPETFRFYPNYPNPFNPSTRLRFDLSRPVSVEIQLINMTGQIVRTLVRGDMPPGSHEILWDGRDEAGRPLATGVYLATLLTRDRGSVHRETRKMMLVR